MCWTGGKMASFLKKLIPKFGEMGFLGANLPTEYGASGVSNVSYGLIMYELERVDSGFRSFASVQGALVMYPIYRYGSEEQKRKYLPQLAAGKMVGCFGLTEHDGGSDPGAMKTRARRDGESYILNGVKMWITNGNIADIAIIWAKDDDDVVRGFVVPTDTPGFQANAIKHKMSMRASVTERACDGRGANTGFADAAGGARSGRSAVVSDAGALWHRVGGARVAGGGV